MFFGFGPCWWHTKHLATFVVFWVWATWAHQPAWRPFSPVSQHPGSLTSPTGEPRVGSSRIEGPEVPRGQGPREGAAHAAERPGWAAVVFSSGSSVFVFLLFLSLFFSYHPFFCGRGGGVVFSSLFLRLSPTVRRLAHL